MEEARFKDWLAGSSYLASEFVLFPLTTSLTRVQALYVNRGITHQRLASFNGIGHIPFLLPGFMCRLKLSSTLDPYLKSQYSLSQVSTFAIVSSISDLINVILKTPSEHYKQQMQVGSYSSARIFCKDYFSSGGIPLFYRGAGLFFLRDSLFNVIRFTLLEYFRDSYKKTRNRRRKYEDDFNRMSPLGQKKLLMENFHIYTWCNVISTIPAAILTTPLDVLKTRVMTQPSRSLLSLKEIFYGIIREEGWSTLFRGVGLRSFYICSMISVSTSLTFYLNLNLDDAKRVRGLMKTEERIDD